MTVKKLYVGIGAGVIGLGIAGAVGYTVLNSRPAPAPAPIAASAAPPAPVANAPASVDDAPVAEFAATSDAAVVTSSTAAYLAPNVDAPQFYPLKVGTPIQGSQKSTDGKWLLALTADGQAAFIPTATLGPYKATESAPAENAPTTDTLSGVAKVIDTATVQIGAQKIPLAGITGEAGDEAKHMQELIDSKGGALDCRRQVAKYVCELKGIGDIARVALYNGAARPGSDASDDYRKQAETAKTARRGVWAAGTEKSTKS